MSHLVTNSTITVMLGGQAQTIDKSHLMFDKVKELIKQKNEAEAFRVMNIREIVRSTGVTVEGDKVFYNNVEVHNYVVTKIVDFLKEGLDTKPLIKFLERLLKNPSKNSVDQLYRFLEVAQLPIDDEGFFYAYKAVKSNYLDKYSGTISNKIGSLVKMDRNKVQDDPNSPCSYGLHVGSLVYVNGFGSGSDIKLICRVDPADVVSVPFDCSSQKCRVASYLVVDHFKDVLPTTRY